VKQSAGILFYRGEPPNLEVLLVHPSGNYNRHAPWSIPKGLPEPGETFEQAARREALEETGLTAGDLAPIGWVDYTRSRKRLHAFAGVAPGETPRCASWEIDQIDFLTIPKASEILHPDQLPLLERLQTFLGGV